MCAIAHLERSEDNPSTHTLFFPSHVTFILSQSWLRCSDLLLIQRCGFFSASGVWCCQGVA